MPPAQCGKKSFGTVWDNTVSILRQGSLLHCSARCTEALLALPNDNECLNKNVPAHDFVYRSFCVPKDKSSKPLAICQKNTCTLSLSSSLFVGSNPTVCNYSISPAVWKICPSGRKRTVHEIVCENVFIQTFVIIRQSEKCFGTPRRAMQNQALPENGYRVIPNSAKRFLSALCRRHLNFQPLLLHE